MCLADVVGQTDVDDSYFYIPLSFEYEHEADENMARKYISAVKPMDGYVRFGNVELSHDEKLSMAEQEHNPQNI